MVFSGRGGAMPRRVIAFTGLTLVAAILAGCMGPEPSPSPTRRPTASPGEPSGIPALASSIDPCTLLTAEQASAINGVTYKGDDGGQPPANGLSMCSWDNATDRAFVEVGFAFWSNAADAEAAYQAAIAAAGKAGYTITPMTGLADVAAIARRAPPTGNGLGAILVRRGALVITVDYNGGTPPADAALRAAAALVLGELPAFAT